jgi:hypothetical protein
MHQESLHRLIQRKIDSGSLPRDSIQRIWGAYSNGDFCDACDEVIRGDEYVMEGISLEGGEKRGLQFHVQCLAIWDEQRQVDDVAVCTLCKKRIIVATQQQLRIQGTLYHASCWDHLQELPTALGSPPHPPSDPGAPGIGGA